MAASLENGKRRKNGIRNLPAFAEKCPFPAVVTDRDGAVLFRNSLAVRRLPTLRRLQKLVSAWETNKEDTCMFPAKIGEEDWLVLTFFGTTGRLFAFIEDPIRHRADLFRALFLEGAEILEEWSLYSDCRDGESLSPAGRSRLSARTKKARDRMLLASRVFASVRRKRDKPCVCGIDGFLHLLSEKLKNARLDLSVESCGGVNALVSPHFLLDAVLNFSQFALLCGMEAEMRAIAERKGKWVELRLCAPKKDDVLRGIAMPTPSGREEILPLLAIAMLCREWDTDFSMKDDGNLIFVSLKLPSGDSQPQMFLGTRSRKEIQMVDRAIEKILFLNKNR